MQELVNANIEALEQVLSLVRAAKGALYTEVPAAVAYGTGRHVRHILDHYVALQSGLDSGHVDYDKRCRDSDVETDSSVAEQRIIALIHWLGENVAADIKLNMKTEISVSNQHHVTVNSSLRRELVYLLNHTLHHCAYASLILRLLGVNTDAHIGIAPATSSYLRANGLRRAG